MKLTLSMPYLPDLKAVGGNSRRNAHWSQRYKAAREAKERWVQEIRACLTPPMPTFKRPSLTITLVFATKRRRDRDNLQTGLKQCLDSMVSWGLLLDDSTDYLGPVDIIVEVDKARSPLTIVEIEGELASTMA